MEDKKYSIELTEQLLERLVDEIMDFSEDNETNHSSCYKAIKILYHFMVLMKSEGTGMTVEEIMERDKLDYAASKRALDGYPIEYE